MYANPISPPEMNLLNLENSWKLLCDKVFGPKHGHPPELEEIGKEIDYQVETWRLIQLWIAEGFIRRPTSDKSLEEVAKDYLEDLISRNLIIVRKSTA
ncbi:hypothetical protein RND71_002386 [Anisodus tanguticus]|uniref:Disease resistance protein winged helix domain-containing protein n=1 Tax=Anisodus tanguticus TaxID=243964 RepID=A0AAE1T2L2_9SOLA|nr:hypothetical protein RND71_002386 [Anisodus tanguticus]